MARVEALSMSGLSAIPAEYVRPQEERQGLGDAYDEAAASWSAAGSPRIPVVHVAGFDAADPGSPASLAVVDAVRAAAEGWGVMHVAGHGIPEELIDQLRGAGTGFFRMPIEDKEAYANDPAAGRLEGYGSRLAGSAGDDGKREWEDYLFHMLHPDARADHALWPAHPPEYVPVTKSFGEHVSALSSRLLAILSLGLGVPANTLERRLRLTSGEAEVEDDLLSSASRPTTTRGAHSRSWRWAWRRTPTSPRSPSSSPTACPACRSSTAPGHGSPRATSRARSSSTSATRSRSSATDATPACSTGGSSTGRPCASPGSSSPSRRPTPCSCARCRSSLRTAPRPHASSRAPSGSTSSARSSRRMINRRGRFRSRRSTLKRRRGRPRRRRSPRKRRRRRRPRSRWLPARNQNKEATRPRRTRS